MTRRSLFGSRKVASISMAMVAKIGTITYSLGSAPVDAITTFTYNNAGMVSTVSVPDPTLNTGAQVPYTYTFDSLGRPTTVRRPDSTTLGNQSGVNMNYSGMTATTTEFAGAALGQSAITTTTKDVFGRLTKVEETVIGTTTAATTYAYDAADNVITVIDPTGVTTAMSHDFIGHRTNISRAGTSWQYTYDKNGNMNSETYPGSTAQIQPDPNYVTVTTYDNLDRPNGRSIGQRGLSAQDQAAFGASYEWMLWDLGTNGAGTLSDVYSYAPGANLPTTASQYVADLQGREEYTYETFSELPAPRSTFRYYNLAGSPSDYYYYDFPAAGRDGVFSRTQYDNRGLPSSILLSPIVTAPFQTIAVQTRNVAGLVTKRHTDVTTGPMTFTESNWTYDQVGRVASQVVQDGPTPTQVARQDLAYFGNDDPKTLDQWLGPSNHKRFTYGYDLRHQITSVGETLLPNAFTAMYAYNAAGRFTAAVETAAALANSDVYARNVTYSYNGNDPEEVTSLVNTDSTIAWSYTYDAAGNQTTRCAGQIVSGSCTGASETDYVYDGNDRLRRATQRSGAAVQGSEEYWYDGHNNRNIIVKKDSAGNKTETIWFINDTEAHYDGSGNWVHSYANVSMGTPVARVDTDSGLVGKVEYQFHGLANNTLAAIDQLTGTVNASFSYAPFGEVVEATNASAGLASHRRRQNDRYLDEITDLTYYGARYYDKTTMLWTQSDPVYRFVPDAAQYRSPRRAALYQFNLENPLKYIDPDGRDSGPVGRDSPGQASDPFCNGVIGICESNKPKDDDSSVESLDGEYLWDLDPSAIDPHNVESSTWTYDRSGNIVRPNDRIEQTSHMAVASLFLGFGVVEAGAAALTSLGLLGGATVSNEDALASAVTDAESRGGSTIRYVTNLTQAPQAGRALSTATGPGADGLASAAREGGTLFEAHIPRAVIHVLEDFQLVYGSITQMGGDRSVAAEVRFNAAAVIHIVKYFKPMIDPMD